MKKFFYVGLIGLGLFEILKVYLIMPMPGSQQSNTIDLAYFIHTYRWVFRILFVLMILIGGVKAFQAKMKWIPALVMIPVIVIIYAFNFNMVADKMFLEPATLTFSGRADNTLSDSTVVIAVEHEGVAKAYPVRFIVYHHQVRDTLGNKPIMVTYCSVCRTGRVYEPVVNGALENFRLVGMDHFNAMFEDATTGSWWRQSTGEAITGSRKGAILPEIQSVQLTANKFFTHYPFGKIMQPETISKESYDSTGRFEKGRSRNQLTRTDSLSWNDKSWVVGISLKDYAKAYDWIDLRKQRVINDVAGNTPVVVALSDDNQSFAVFIRHNSNQVFGIRNDTLFAGNEKYDFTGKALQETENLRRVNAYQEFWHSWKQFHPKTETYPEKK